MRILGISAFYHDSAAALIEDGRIVAAAQEERFSRRKHDEAFPHGAVAYCLSAGGVAACDLDHVAFYDKPFLKFERLLETYLSFAPSGFASFKAALPVWVKDKLFQKQHLIRELAMHLPSVDLDAKLLFSEHHFAHAASAFYPSPFEDALVLTMDGVGEWATTSAAIGRGRELEIFKELHFPHSLGLLYSAFTYYTGFKVNSGEYKVMGLAPYGTPKYADLILENLVDLKDDGSFRLNQEYFNYCTGLTMTNERFDALFGGPPRDPESLLTARDMDLAASVQAVTEEIALRMTRALVKQTGLRTLCLAGGVALNCVANGKILRDGTVEKLWVQPAAGDAGGALGAALAGYHGFLSQPRQVRRGDAMQGSLLGPDFAQDDIEDRLSRMGAQFTVANSEEQFLADVADTLVEGRAVGWFQGRMEYGPRALGGRSILGDPRSSSMQRDLNLKIKFRESFRPFAPSVLREEIADWFELDEDSPYMLIVSDVVPSRRRTMSSYERDLFGLDKLNVIRSDIPAVTHVDYSARIQTVDAETNPRYHALLEAFRDRTGCPVLINTSFNIRGEPIVCTPEDAFRCFMGTELDLLAIGNCLLKKEDQDASLRIDYRAEVPND